jgi:hypothetical protein
MLEQAIRGIKNQENWRCRAMTVDLKKENRIRITCRDEAEHQLDWLRSQYIAASSNSNELNETHLNIESRRALRLLEIATPGRAAHLGCCCASNHEDFLVMTEDDYFPWAKNFTEPEVVVIRDRRYIERSGEPFSAQQFLEDIGQFQESRLSVSRIGLRRHGCVRRTRRPKRTNGLLRSRQRLSLFLKLSDDGNVLTLQVLIRH